MRGPLFDAAEKACPDMKPFLRIETGMHVATISRIGVDAACRRLATSSDDKTVRIWSLPDGRLEQTIRLPIGDGDGGKVYAAGLSPDGRTLAAGGYDAFYDKQGSDALYLVDLASGAVRRLGAWPSVIDSIAWSPDGSKVAVGLYAGGVRVFAATSGREAMSDPAYGDRVEGLAFGVDGALFSASWDGAVRRYGKTLALEVKSGPLAGKRPFGVAVRPDGSRLAVGFLDEAKAAILDARMLKTIAAADTRGIDNGDLSSVAWSNDGTQFAAGGQAQVFSKGAWKQFVRRFDANGHQRGTDAFAALNAIQDLRACGDGFVFASGEPSFGLLDANGSPRTLRGPDVADMRDKLGPAFAVSADAARVRFGLGYGETQPVLFDLAAATVADSPSAPADLVAARVEGLPIEARENEYRPTFGGAKIALDKYEKSRALALRRDGHGFALGTNFWVRAFDASGHPLWKRPGPGDACGVDYAAADKLLVVAYNDGTIRWLRASDGAELLALFVEPQSRKWVAWTPSGYYMASAGGEDLIGWHLNRGWSQLADFFPASQFRAQFNRPDIVKLVLTTLDEAQAVKRANEATEREAAPAKPSAFPPVVTILSPAEGASVTGDTVAIDYALRSPSGLAIDRLDVLVDGQPVTASGFTATEAAEAQGRVTLAKPSKARAKITLIAHAGALTSAPVGVDLAFSAPAVDIRPKLYALLIGVTGYQDKELDDIQFAGRDAESFAEALGRQKGGLYADVQTRIVDMPASSQANPDRAGPPTRDQVFKGLQWLKQNATKFDLSVVYLSGHGYATPSGKFWFLTQEADLDLLETSAVSGDELLDRLRGLKGKKLLFIDACYAGAALTPAGAKAPATATRPNMDQMVNAFTAADTGIVAYAAAQAQEIAFEN
ncbi:MAG: caspase family protein, partial [Roseiarcus sp.]